MCGYLATLFHDIRFLGVQDMDVVGLVDMVIIA